MNLSALETLPYELLEPIFLLSGCNIALLKASPYLGMRFSNLDIYNSSCDAQLTRVQPINTNRSANQTVIFASRWMTWTFFKSWIMRRFKQAGCLCGSTPDEGCFDAQWPPDFEDITQMTYSRCHLPRLAFLKARLPKKLLQGPWTQDKVQFLRFLLWITSMTVDWADSETRQLVSNAKNLAIIEKNLEVVELFNHNRRLGRAPDMDLVRFAVLDAGCDRSVIYDTLFSVDMWGSSTASRDCPLLDAWCNDRIKEDDPKGQWLRTKLQEFRRIPDRHRVTQREGQLPVYRAEINSATGDYDAGIEDYLIANQLAWDKVSVSDLNLAMLSTMVNK